MSNTIRKIWNAATWILVLMIAALAVLLAGVRLVGLTPYTVLSGSMEPAYPVGAIIYVRQTPPEQIRIGDPITFYLGGDKTVATHRVVAVDNQTRSFQTKGDANEAADAAPVGFDDLIGRPVFSIPRLGLLSSWLSTPPGTYISMSAAAAVMLLLLLPDLFAKPKKHDKS